jgi:hypothetical protein
MRTHWEPDENTTGRRENEKKISAHPNPTQKKINKLRDL